MTKKQSTDKHAALRTWLRRGILSLLLILIGWMTFFYTQPAADEAALPPATPAPATADERALRETAYEQDLLALEKLLQSGAADADTQAQAARRMERMIADHQSEAAIEDALRRSGFDPAMVLVHNGAITIIVKEKQVQADVSTSILNLCTAHTDISAENIRIMPSAP